MVKSFIKEASWLDKFLLNIQVEGWKVISITPIEEKEWSSTCKAYVDKNKFVIIAENEKLKPTREWVVSWKENGEYKNKVLYTEEQGKDFFMKAKKREKEGKIEQLDVWYRHDIVEV